MCCYCALCICQYSITYLIIQVLCMICYILLAHYVLYTYLCNEPCTSMMARMYMIRTSRKSAQNSELIEPP